MRQQFAHVSARYGAPMGRQSFGRQPEQKCRLFRVRLDSGGYDDGGAYWGINRRGEALYCATDGADYREFVRAASRFEAAARMDLDCALLAVPLESGRYAVAPEFCGQPAARFVLRHFGAFVSHRATRADAWNAAITARRIELGLD